MEIICSFWIVLVLFLDYYFVKYYIRVNVALSIPGLFNQIFTILILIDDPMTHVVYAPIPGNRQRIYIRFFTLLHDKFNDLSLQLSPSSAIANFWDHSPQLCLRSGFLASQPKDVFSTLPKQYGVRYSRILQRRR